MTDQVAVVGMACRLPGANTPEALWELVCSGATTFEQVTREESQAWGWTPLLCDRPDFVAVRSALSDVDMFDAQAFGVPPREALLMDPQQRIFVETVRCALDDAQVHDGARVGVFASCTISSYLAGPLSDAGLWHSHDLAYAALLGCDKDFMASRASYLLDLTGPSVVVQTACSSSLTAVHMARISLLRGECDVAVVGGASISLPSLGGYLAPPESIFSPVGDCRPFDAAAAGTVKGNGVAAVVLVRCDAGDDRVYALVTGSAVNNDGADRAGYSAPGVTGQTQVIAQAHSQAAGHGGPLRYVETHGTGTRLGDPIEALGLVSGLGDGGPVALGSLKATMGHLDAAADVGGLLKACLVVRHRTVPPLAGFTEPNPLLALGRLWVPTECEPVDGPLSVGVSSFGMGGANAHVVVASGTCEGPRPCVPPRDYARTRYWPTASAAAAPQVEEVRHAVVTFTVDQVLDMTREAFLDPSVEPDDNLFELGDSFAVLSLLSDLEAAGVRLQMADVQQAPTVRRLAEHLAQRHVAPGAEPTPVPGAPRAPRVRAAAVRLSDGDPTVFLMHPAGGTTVCYLDLARQLPCAVQALAYPAQALGQDLSLRELASAYLQAVRDVQPSGPYWLGGWSLGGNLAAQMAAQLADEGVDDVGLVMVDSHPPHAYVTGTCTTDDYLQAFPPLLRQMFPGVRFSSAPEAATSPRQVLELAVLPPGPAPTVDQLDEFYAIWVDNHRMLKGWLPDQPICCPTLVVEATEPEDAQVLDLLGITATSVHEWDRYITDATYVCAPGDHYSVMRTADAVQTIAAAVSRFVTGR
ncbi:MAG: thioesterase domain-containing protein [Micrococcales bacterium]|nr:thioesterase domain-containing protein [Micrococcales bacterium]